MSKSFTNLPIPMVFPASNLQGALHLYQTEVEKVLQQGLKDGIYLSVHTIQIVPPSTVVVFIEEDIFKQQAFDALDMQTEVFSKLKEHTCEHEWGSDATCIKCGAKI